MNKKRKDILENMVLIHRKRLNQMKNNYPIFWIFALAFTIGSCTDNSKTAKREDIIVSSEDRDSLHLNRIECIVTHGAVAAPRYRYFISCSNSLLSSKFLNKEFDYLVVYSSNDTIKQHQYSSYLDGAGNVIIEYSYMPTSNYPSCDNLSSVHKSFRSSRIVFYDSIDKPLIIMRDDDMSTIISFEQ